MNLSTYVPVLLRSEDTSVECRCYSYGMAGDKLAYALITGPEQTCQAVFSNMVSRKGLLFIDDQQRGFFTDFNFRREVTRVQPVNTRWVSMLIMTKAPGVMYQDDDLSFVTALKRVTNTPFLESWANYLREGLTNKNLMTKLTGHNALGSYLAAKTEELDTIVSEGLRSKAISITL